LARARIVGAGWGGPLGRWSAPVGVRPDGEGNGE